jgi:hypothetical protein
VEKGIRDWSMIVDKPSEKANGHEILRAVQILRQPGEVAEIRAFSARGSASGYFDDYGKLAECAADLDAKGYQVYGTLNPVVPTLLARSENRLESRLKATTTDGDVMKRAWLPIDLDPVRPSGISASEPEKQAAVWRAVEIRGYLTEKGWPDPLEADSGNGAHLLYRVDIPNDQESLDLVRGVLAALDFVFSDRAVSVDTGVANAARIWKLYGTTARKGDSTEDRPHRRSRLLRVPGAVHGAKPSELSDWK